MYLSVDYLFVLCLNHVPICLSLWYRYHTISITVTEQPLTASGTYESFIDAIQWFQAIVAVIVSVVACDLCEINHTRYIIVFACKEEKPQIYLRLGGPDPCMKFNLRIATQKRPIFVIKECINEGIKAIGWTLYTSGQPSFWFVLSMVRGQL